MLKVKKYSREDKIYGYTDHCHFGDTWAVTNYLLRLSEETGVPSRFFTKRKTVRDMIQQIRPYLISKGSINLVHEAAERVFFYCEPYSAKFVPTIRTWDTECVTSKIVAYQFDGLHLGKQKNLPPERLQYILQSLRQYGFILIDVGHYRSIDGIINTLSNCRFFVGCPSGLSVVARSVCCPIMLITRQLEPGMKSFLKSCQYRGTGVQMFTTVDQFLIALRSQLYQTVSLFTTPQIVVK